MNRPRLERPRRRRLDAAQGANEPSPLQMLPQSRVQQLQSVAGTLLPIFSFFRRAWLCPRNLGRESVSSGTNNNIVSSTLKQWNHKIVNSEHIHLNHSVIHLHLSYENAQLEQ